MLDGSFIFEFIYILECITLLNEVFSGFIMYIGSMCDFIISFYPGPLIFSDDFKQI